MFSETLRLHPPAGVLKRECSKEYIIPGSNIRVPVGMNLYIPLYSLHMDPEYFPEPEKFKPERFENGKVPAVYFPFGKGPRICAGKSSIKI